MESSHLKKKFGSWIFLPTSSSIFDFNKFSHVIQFIFYQIEQMLYFKKETY